MTFASTFRASLITLLFGCFTGAHAADLPEPVRRALGEAGIPESNVAVWLQPVDSSRPRLAENVDRPMNPASVMKLVTAFATLERFGPAHAWTTRVAANGPIHGGVLDGDLFIIGGGDPILSDERVWKLLRRVRALGIDMVRGDIVLDGSALSLPPHDPNAFDGRGLRPYNSATHGALLHFNTLQLALLPADTAGEPVTVAANPPLRGLDVDNRIATADGECGVWYANLESRLEAAPTGRRLVLLGSLPARCGRRDWGVSPLPPEQFAVAAIAGLWAEAGGKVGGSVRPGTAPANGRVLLEEKSPPLADALRDMNKWSSNVIARQLLATLGRGAAGTGGAPPGAANVGDTMLPDGAVGDRPVDLAPSPADRQQPPPPGPAVTTYGVTFDSASIDAHPIDAVAAGRDAVRAHLAAAGIDTAGLVIENGSGLSRIESVTARMLGELLLAAWRRPFMPEFVGSLPVAGVDGTARTWLAGSPASGHAHVKTGYLNGVRAIAGYVLDRNGRRHAVAMLVNDPRAGDSRPAQDALLEWVWESGGEPLPPVPVPEAARTGQ